MRRTWTWTVTVVVAGALAVVGCAPPSTLPDGSVPQDPPLGVNGMVEEDGSVWIADLFGGKVAVFTPTGDGSYTRRVLTVGG